MTTVVEAKTYKPLLLPRMVLEEKNFMGKPHQS